MQTTTLSVLRHQLEHRRGRLRQAIAEAGPAADLVRLLGQVDAALDNLGGEDYGRCLVCHEALDEPELLRNPIAQYCLCRLTPQQQDALQHDLDLAWRIQSALLPDPDLRADGWSVHYRYEPAGPVSGDYCDLWETPADGIGDGFYFFVGDVSGKGVSASLLMAHLNAAFRAHLEPGRPLTELVERANRLLLQSTLASHYATLVAGRAGRDGAVEIVNAGHCPPLAVRAGGLEPIASTGFPIGILEDRPYEVHCLRLGPGEALFLYTDGLTEARGRGGEEYGAERLGALLDARRGLPARQLVEACHADLVSFLGGARPSDDLTLMVLQRGTQSG